MVWIKGIHGGPSQNAVALKMVDRLPACSKQHRKDACANNMFFQDSASKEDLVCGTGLRPSI